MPPQVSGVRVLCRFRPFNSREKEEFSGKEQGVEVLYDGGTVKLHRDDDDHTFNFDIVFSPEYSQEHIYDEGVRCIIGDTLAGYNGTVFAYGQTGSGKSFTMFGPTGYKSSSNDWGIIPRACSEVLEECKKSEGEMECTITGSYLEVYKEQIRDLLDPTKTNLPIRESPIEGVYVQHLTSTHIHDIGDVWAMLDAGEAHKAKAATKMNATSSRSHSVFSISVSQRSGVDGTMRVGRVKLVDLAGSEKVGKTGASGEVLEQAKKINKSLSALGNCIFALTSRKAHIPYRDSKLTRILQESLGGNTKTTLIVCCSPHEYNYDETLSTLRFAQRAKLIKNSVKANVHLSVAMLEEMVRQLKTQLQEMCSYARGLELTIEWMSSADYQPGAANPYAVTRPNCFDSGNLLTDDRSLLLTNGGNVVIPSETAESINQENEEETIGDEDDEEEEMHIIEPSDGLDNNNNNNNNNNNINNQINNSNNGNIAATSPLKSPKGKRRPTEGDLQLIRDKNNQYRSPTPAAPSISAEQAKKYEDTIQELKASVIRLQFEAAEAETLKETLNQERSAGRTLLLNNQNKIEELEKRNAELEEDIKRVCGEAEQSRKNYEEKLGIVKQESAAAVASLNDMTMQTMKFESNLAVVQSQLKQVEQQRMEEENQHEKEKDRLITHAAGLETQTASLQTKIASLEGELEHVRSYANDLVKLRDKSRKAKRKSLELGSQIVTFESLHRQQMKDLMDELNQLKESMAKQQEKIQQQEVTTQQQQIQQQIQQQQPVMLQISPETLDILKKANQENDASLQQKTVEMLSDQLKTILESQHQAQAQAQAEHPPLAVFTSSLEPNTAATMDILDKIMQRFSAVAGPNTPVTSPIKALGSPCSIDESAEEHHDILKHLLDEAVEGRRNAEMMADNATINLAGLKGELARMMSWQSETGKEMQKAVGSMTTSLGLAKKKCEEDQLKIASLTAEIGMLRSEFDKTKESLSRDVECFKERAAVAEGHVNGLNLQLSALNLLLHGDVSMDSISLMGASLESTREALRSSQKYVLDLEAQVKSLRDAVAVLQEAKMAAEQRTDLMLRTINESRTRSRSSSLTMSDGEGEMGDAGSVNGNGNGNGNGNELRSNMKTSNGEKLARFGELVQSVEYYREQNRRLEAHVQSLQFELDAMKRVDVEVSALRRDNQALRKELDDAETFRPKLTRTRSATPAVLAKDFRLLNELSSASSDHLPVASQMKHDNLAIEVKQGVDRLNLAKTELDRVKRERDSAKSDADNTRSSLLTTQKDLEAARARNRFLESMLKNDNGQGFEKIEIEVQTDPMVPVSVQEFISTQNPTQVSISKIAEEAAQQVTSDHVEQHEETDLETLKMQLLQTQAKLQKYETLTPKLEHELAQTAAYLHLTREDLREAKRLMHGAQGKHGKDCKMQ